MPQQKETLWFTPHSAEPVQAAPAGAPPAWQTHYLYNHPLFVASRPGDKAIMAYLAHEHSLVAIANLNLVLVGDEAISLPASPFGGIEGAGAVTRAAYEHFIKAVCQWLPRQGIHTITLTLWPSAYYAPAHAQQKQALLALGFALTGKDAHHTLPVHEGPYTAQLHHMERRRLKKCHQAGFRFAQAHDLPQAYTLIARWRQQKGMRLSLTLSQLLQEVARFPEAYTAYMVYHGEQPVAGTIAVQVSETIMYNFYPASDVAYNTYSPMVMLIEGLYGQARQQGIAIIDLGTSMLGNQPNAGLIRFKEHVGGRPGLLETYCLNLKPPAA